VGSDIDARVIHGLGVGKINTRSPFYRDNTALIETIKPKFLLNFLQYGLRQPEILRMDASEPAFRNTCAVFDAIICDPPYGIRATKRKTVGKGVGNSPQAVQQV
jgi:tRNA (guanine10-N2)-methyltransferase